MNSADIIIVAVVAVLTAFCLYRIFKGKASCSGNCSSCSKGCAYREDNKDDEV